MEFVNYYGGFFLYKINVKVDCDNNISGLSDDVELFKKNTKIEIQKIENGISIEHLALTEEDRDNTYNMIIDFKIKSDDKAIYPVGISQKAQIKNYGMNYFYISADKDNLKLNLAHIIEFLKERGFENISIGWDGKCLDFYSVMDAVDNGEISSAKAGDYFVYSKSKDDICTLDLRIINDTNILKRMLDDGRRVYIGEVDEWDDARKLYELTTSTDAKIYATTMYGEVSIAYIPRDYIEYKPDSAYLDSYRYFVSSDTVDIWPKLLEYTKYGIEISIYATVDGKGAYIIATNDRVTTNEDGYNKTKSFIDYYKYKEISLSDGIGVIDDFIDYEGILKIYNFTIDNKNRKLLAISPNFEHLAIIESKLGIRFDIVEVRLYGIDRFYIYDKVTKKIIDSSNITSYELSEFLYIYDVVEFDVEDCYLKERMLTFRKFNIVDYFGHDIKVDVEGVKFIDNNNLQLEKGIRIINKYGAYVDADFAHKYKDTLLSTRVKYIDSCNVEDIGFIAALAKVGKPFVPTVGTEAYWDIDKNIISSTRRIIDELDKSNIHYNLSELITALLSYQFSIYVSCDNQAVFTNYAGDKTFVDGFGVVDFFRCYKVTNGIIENVEIQKVESVYNSAIYQLSNEDEICENIAKIANFTNKVFVNKSISFIRLDSGNVKLTPGYVFYTLYYTPLSVYEVVVDNDKNGCAVNEIAQDWIGAEYFELTPDENGVYRIQEAMLIDDGIEAKAKDGLYVDYDKHIGKPARFIKVDGIKYRENVPIDENDVTPFVVYSINAITDSDDNVEKIEVDYWVNDGFGNDITDEFSTITLENYFLHKDM